MSNPRPIRLFTPVGTARYPKLNKPDFKFNPEGMFSAKVAIPIDECEELVGQLEQIRDDFFEAQDVKTRKVFKVAPVFTVELDDEGNETGNYLFNGKMKAHIKTKAGKEWDQRPALFDAANNVIDPELVNIGGGTQMRLQVEAAPYAMSSTKEVGVSLRLRAVQIVKLVEFGGSSPFGEVAGGEVVKPKAKPSFDDTTADASEDALDDEDF